MEKGNSKKRNVIISIYTRLILMFLLIAIVFLVSFGSVTIYLYNLLNQQYKESVSQSAKAVISYVEQNVNSILYAETALSNDLDVKSVAACQKEDLEDAEIGKVIQKLKDKMKIVTPTAFVIRDISIYFPNSENQLGRNQFIHISQDTYLQFYEATKNSYLNSYLGELYIKTLRFENFYISCELDQYSFSGMLDNLSESDQSSMKIGNILLGDSMEKFFQKEEGIYSFRQRGKFYYLSVEGYGGAMAYTLVDGSRISVVLNTAIWITIGVSIIIIGTVITYIIFSKHALQYPLQDLCRFVLRLKNGEYGIALSGQYPGEFGELIESFNKLSKQLEYYIKIEVNNQLTIRDMKLKQLHAQMNPHFLFNCFTMFKNLLSEKKFDTALELSEDLSLYFKTSLNKGKTVSLMDEVMGAKIYADIQNKRKNGLISFEVQELPLSYYAYRVPKFIIQPIVENAFNYAFEDGEKHVLKIQSKQEDEYIVLQIYNDGNIQEEDFIKIQEVLNGTSEKDGMSALDNINRILRFFNKSDKGVEAKLEREGISIFLWLKIASCINAQEEEKEKDRTKRLESEHLMDKNGDKNE